MLPRCELGCEWHVAKTVGAVRPEHAPRHPDPVSVQFGAGDKGAGRAITDLDIQKFVGVADEHPTRLSDFTVFQRLLDGRELQHACIGLDRGMVAHQPAVLQRQQDFGCAVFAIVGADYQVVETQSLVMCDPFEDKWAFLRIVDTTQNRSGIYPFNSFVMAGQAARRRAKR